MFPLDLTVAVYAFCVRSNNAYITAPLGLYSVYTSVDTRIRILYGCVLNKPRDWEVVVLLNSMTSKFAVVVIRSRLD